MTPRLAIIIPCYNEQAILPHSLEVIGSILQSLIDSGEVSDSSFILCVDDGSRDATWQLIAQAHDADPRIKGILLAHNRGQQFALIAGMDAVTDMCDICITLDADLQDDPNAIPAMIKAYRDGAEIVFGQRSSRERDSWLKRTTSHAFYSLQRAMGIETVSDHAEFRLMSHRALQLLAQYGERSIYLRGIIAQLGLKTAIVQYPRAERTAGESKYSFRSLLSLAAVGVTSFTAKPISWILNTGLLLLFIDIIVAIWALISWMSGYAVSGWTSLILSVWFLGSLTLIAIGIVGLYIGKIFLEVKQRPRYAVESKLM